MKKGNIVFFIISILFLISCPIFGIVYHNQIIDNDVRTLRIINPLHPKQYPIIEQNSADFISLSFDDLNPSFRYFSYKIIHCNADWTPSDLSEMEYINGFATGYIETSSASMNTYVPYVHHSVKIPNNNLELKVSGNYAIIIFLDNDERKLVLSARFSVNEQKININGSVSGITSIDYKKEHQELRFEIQHMGFQIINPERDIKVLVQQNQRIDNEVRNIRPHIIANEKITYQNNQQLIFKGGNEFRNFDISSTRILSNRVNDIRYIAPNYHVFMYPDEIRNKAWYTHNFDVNGRMIINVQQTRENDTEADYFYVHFTLPSARLNEDVHLMGQYNQYQLNANSLMSYNASNNQYEKTLLLKQGGYDYAYVSTNKVSPIAKMDIFEGNYWQTENDYAIYVYYRGFTDRYDRLIGVNIINPN